MADREPLETLRNRLFKENLDAHGYGFQYRTVERIAAEFGEIWSVEGEEIPVQVGTHETHVEFVLKSSKAGGLVLVGECKRADPARADWCFAQASQRGTRAWIEEATTHHDSSDRLFAIPQNFDVSPASVYHVAFPISTGTKGNGIGSHNSAIDGAATQVIRSTSGFLNAAAEGSYRHTFIGHQALVIPCIITTARLFTTNVDLAAASATGEMPAFEMRDAMWVWYQQALSRSLHHKVPGRWIGVETAREYVERGHTRAVAIVNHEFFRDFTGDLLRTFEFRNAIRRS